MNIKLEVLAHNAIVANVTFFSECMTKLEGENAELRRVSSAMAVELKQAANRFAAIKVAAGGLSALLTATRVQHSEFPRILGSLESLVVDIQKELQDK